MVNINNFNGTQIWGSMVVMVRKIDFFLLYKRSVIKKSIVPIQQMNVAQMKKNRRRTIHRKINEIKMADSSKNRRQRVESE